MKNYVLYIVVAIIAFLAGWFLLAKPAGATFEPPKPPVICHHAPGNDVTKRFDNWTAYLGHTISGHGGPVFDTQSACPEPEPPVCNWTLWSRCSVECGGGVQHRTLGGDRECKPDKESRECNTQACEIPNPTKRLCHWDEHGFVAKALAKKQYKWHFKNHKRDIVWEEGMDASCEFPEEPTPEPFVPAPVVRTIGPAGFTPACYGVTHPVIPWASATRDGSDATINYVPTTGVGDFVNVVFDESPFDIIFGLGSHGLRDERPNDGSVELHDLVPGQSYWFRIANGCARWSGIFLIP